MYQFNTKCTLPMKVFENKSQQKVICAPSEQLRKSMWPHGVLHDINHESDAKL